MRRNEFYTRFAGLRTRLKAGELVRYCSVLLSLFVLLTTTPILITAERSLAIQITHTVVTFNVPIRRKYTVLCNPLG
jgi:hypothetical protein